MSLTVHRDLTTELAGQVADLIDVTRVQDGVSPVSEETTLRLHTSRPSRWLHLLYHAHGDLVGYAHLDNGDPKAPWAELLVGPHVHTGGSPGRWHGVRSWLSSCVEWCPTGRGVRS